MKPAFRFGPPARIADQRGEIAAFERQIARDFGAAVDDELVSPIRDAARRGQRKPAACEVTVVQGLSITGG